MAVHKLNEDDFEEADYFLIAIHSVLEDYRLAYFINKQLQVNLVKCTQNIPIKTKNGESHFVHFEYEDESQMVGWNLIQNHNEYLSLLQPSTVGFFNSDILKTTTKSYLIPELKKVDYFLKIENGLNIISLDKVLESLRKIEKITTVYAVDKETIKSKNNLIF